MSEQTQAGQERGITAEEYLMLRCQRAEADAATAKADLKSQAESYLGAQSAWEEREKKLEADAATAWALVDKLAEWIIWTSTSGVEFTWQSLQAFRDGPLAAALTAREANANPQPSA